MNKNLTVGRIVRYVLSDADAAQINKRYNDYAKADKTVDTGFQAHVGNRAKAGDVLPLIICKVWESGSINGQVLLDGNDQFWATSREEGDEPGKWAWPEIAKQPKKEEQK